MTDEEILAEYSRIKEKYNTNPDRSAASAEYESDWEAMLIMAGINGNEMNYLLIHGRRPEKT